MLHADLITPTAQSDERMDLLTDNRPLLDAFRRGESDAMRQVFDANVDRVTVLIRRGYLLADARGRVLPPLDQEIERDLVQEVFARAFTSKARLSYDGLRPYQPFVLQIARNVLADHWRKRGREQSVAMEPEQLEQLLDQVEQEPERAADELLEFKELAAATRAFVQQLDQLQKDIVTIRFEKGIGQRDAARALGITRWKLRSLEDGIRKRLAAHLRNKGLLDV